MSSARNDMRSIVLSVLVGARARWAVMKPKDRLGVVRHMRAIADVLERAIAEDKTP